MTKTPWGNSDRLRSRKLRPGPSVDREEVVRNQRERLYAAIVAAVDEHGYEATRVADVLQLSGVSRNTFYKLFDNKLDCFLATMEAIVAAVRGRIVAAYREDRTWDEQLGAAFHALIDAVVEQPAAARLCLLEVHAAGPEAIERLEQLRQAFEELVCRALRESPERADMPRDLVRAGLGGLRQVIMSRLRRREERELLELAPDLLDWALSYRAPPEPLHRPRRRPALELPPPPDRDEPRRRILDAVASVVAEKGYAEATIADVASAASVSFTTFYSHFDGKEEAFLAALDYTQRRLLENVLPYYRAAPDWPHAVVAGIDAFFAFLATDTAAAAVKGLYAFASGPEALELREQSVLRFRGLLLDGYELYPGTSPLADEAIGASISALLFYQLHEHGAERVYEIAPAAAFVALGAFVGTELACALANEIPTEAVRSKSVATSGDRP
jgi:AcrR family transcriptional regulator